MNRHRHRQSLQPHRPGLGRLLAVAGAASLTARAGQALRIATAWAVFSALIPTLVPQAHAQTPGGSRASLSEGEFLREIPVVFTASRLPQLPEDAPGGVTVLDRAFIQALGARDLAEALRFVPGFIVGLPRGGQPVVAYHGLSSQIAQRVQVIVDGRSLYAPYLFGGVDWGALNLHINDIERIEVVRGSNSSTFGANAFLGVIFITTRSPAQVAGVEAHAETGSNGIRSRGARWGIGGAGWSARLSAGQRGDEGLVGLADTRRQRYLDARAEFQPSSDSEVTVQAGLSQQRLGMGFPAQPVDPERPGRADSRFVTLRWQQSLNRDHEWAATLSHTIDAGQDRYSLFLGPDEFLDVDYSRRATRTATSVQLTSSWSPWLRSVVGLEARRDSVLAPQLFNTANRQTSDSARGYANVEWQPHAAITSNLGLSFENDRIAGQQFAPRGFINFKISPGHTLKLGQSSAFRTPSLFEQRSDWRLVYRGTTLDIRFLSQGNLAPERITATELVYQGDWPAHGLSIDARLFRERIRELITSSLYVLPPGPGIAPGATAYDLRNAGQVDLNGIEYRARWSPAPPLQFVATQFRRLAIESDQTRLTNSVPQSASSLVAALSLGSQWQASVSRTAVTGLNWIGESTPADPQRITGFRVAWRVPVGPARTEWALQARRVDDSRQEYRELQRLRNEGWLTFSAAF